MDALKPSRAIYSSDPLMEPQRIRPGPASTQHRFPIGAPRRASTLPVRFNDAEYYPRSANISREGRVNYSDKRARVSEPHRGSSPHRNHARRDSSISSEIESLINEKLLSRSSLSSINHDDASVLILGSPDETDEESESEIYKFSLPHQKPSLKESIKSDRTSNGEGFRRPVISEDAKLPSFATIQRIQRSEYTGESLIGGLHSVKILIDNAPSTSKPLFRWM